MKKVIVFWALMGLAIGAVLAERPRPTATRYVDCRYPGSIGDDANDGTTEAEPMLTIRAALASVPEGWAPVVEIMGYYCAHDFALPLLLDVDGTTIRGASDHLADIPLSVAVRARDVRLEGLELLGVSAGSGSSLYMVGCVTEAISAFSADLDLVGTWAYDSIGFGAGGAFGDGERHRLRMFGCGVVFSRFSVACLDGNSCAPIVIEASRILTPEFRVTGPTSGNPALLLLRDNELLIEPGGVVIEGNVHLVGDAP